MDKQKLTNEKMALVGQLNALQERVMEFGFETDETREQKEVIKGKIDEINKLLDTN